MNRHRFCEVCPSIVMIPQATTTCHFVYFNLNYIAKCQLPIVISAENGGVRYVVDTLIPYNQSYYFVTMFPCLYLQVSAG
jgi:hypothetical protein